MKNQLDVLRTMLDEAHIPYENYIIPYTDDEKYLLDDRIGDYRRNQIFYGGEDFKSCKLDAICQYGSYGYEEGLIETAGPLGSEYYDRIRWEPIGCRTAEEVFEVIKKDWEESR
ncbi:MAG: hypothetical protein IKP88_21785 [Lachnospiraceae bacterium]|nr:hypothetical protein [Lachnospiraceae bacterium]